MGSEWTHTLIGEVCQIGDGAHAKVERTIYGIPYLTSKNIGIGSLKLDGIDYISEVDFNRLFPENSKAVTRLRVGDILTGIIGTFGNIYQYKERDHFGISSAVAILRPDQERLWPKYFYYFLTSSYFRQMHHAYAAGSVQGYTNLPTIRQLPAIVPPIPEQKAIAHILGSLDDKIELNRRINETLEGMAQALFKSWFVDFDPVIDNALIAGNPISEELVERAEVRRKVLADGTANREVSKQFSAAFQLTEKMGWVPKGWETLSLEILIELIGGGTPKTSIDEYWNGNIPWFSVVDSPNDSDVFVIDTEKKITELGVKNSSTKILRKGSTIISARGTVGKCALLGKEMAMNQSCYGINGVKGISDIYTYYTIREFVADLQQRGHGSVFNTITRDTFKSIHVPFGKTELTHDFDKTVKPFLERIRFNLFQNVALTELRDTLLPKLISGELRIPEAERIAEEALS